MLATHFVLILGFRYQLCNFSCATEANATADRWQSCRAEKCTPRLPEDACAGGNEAALIGPDGGKAADEGVAVSGPQECETMWAVVEAEESPPPPPAGSFGERCDLCMSLLGEASSLWEAAVAEGRPTGGDADLCAEAAASTERALLPTVRTCRLHAPACSAVVEATRERACPETWQMLHNGSAKSRLRAAQQRTCGALMTQRGGSGVDDALVCPVPRDVGMRVMAITFAVGVAIFAAQWFRV